MQVKVNIELLCLYGTILIWEGKLMKSLLVLSKIISVISTLFLSGYALANATVNAKIINYSVEPRSGATFNVIEQLSIILFVNKLSKEYRSPYSLTYTVEDKNGNIVNDRTDNIRFTLCNDRMLQVKIVGSCEAFNNVATVRLKTRQTRKPISTKGYSKEGRFWTQDEAAGKYPKFEEMEYQLKSFSLVDKNGKIVK